VTVSAEIPLFPSLVAVMVAMPGATAFTSPVTRFTVATAELSELQATLLPESTLPFTSSVIAVACVAPPATIEVSARDTVTVATGAGVTMIAPVALFSSLVAVMVALPAERAVTKPVSETVAMALLLVFQLTNLPVSG
jgi:hypothetical protein